MRLPAPSESSCQDNGLYELLKDENIRKLYNKIINSCRKYHQSMAKTWFLQMLIENKIIPSYFKVKNKSHDNTTEAATKTSIEWMNVSLKESESADATILQEMADHYNHMLLFTPEHLKEELWSKVQHRGLGFQKHYREEKFKRFQKLKDPPKTQNKPHQKPKQRRKWVSKSKYQRITRKLKKQNISIIYNYSSLTLTPAMESLLNRGMNFALTPNKVDFTKLLVEFKYFERSLLWKDYWSNQPPQEEEYKPGIFKKKKSNFPKDHHPPKALKDFISATRSELEDPQNRNKNIHPNITSDEAQALSELINLQKNRVITIKECDKGGGIIILDTDEYIRSCNQHLSSKLKNSDGSESPYYCKVGEEFLEKAKSEILNVLKRAADDKIISSEEFDGMDPTGKGAATFYQLFKVHKPHQEGRAPPERPIISGSGSITEGISQYVQHHIKDLSVQHPSYTQDTPDLLRTIAGLENIPDDAILVTCDISALYTNIQRHDGVEAVKKVLETRKDKTIPSDFIIELLDLVLKYNIFVFDGQLYQQLIGTAIGTKCAPNVADIFMSFIDEKIKNIAMKFGQNGLSPLLLFRRFLDDILFLF